MIARFLAWLGMTDARPLPDRCLDGWCVYRDGDCLKCGWPEPKGTL